MRYEVIQMARGAGKTRFLAERVCELQDAGFDPVVVIVPASRWVNHWFELLMEVGIDPSRLIIHTSETVRRGGIRGIRAAYLVDDGDMIPRLKDVLNEVWPGAANDVITITTTRSLEV